MVKSALLERLGPGPAADPPPPKMSMQKKCCFAVPECLRILLTQTSQARVVAFSIQDFTETPSLLWVGFPCHPLPSLVIAAANGFIGVRL